MAIGVNRRYLHHVGLIDRRLTGVQAVLNYRLNGRLCSETTHFA